MSQTPKLDWVMNTFYAPAMDYIAAGLALLMVSVVLFASGMAVYTVGQIIADWVRSWRR